MKTNSYIYILASQKNGTLYIGVTTNLKNRIYTHKQNFPDGFTKKYDIKLLVYFESVDTIQSAILREKQIEKWNREWKLRLIEKENPQWRDLSEDFLDSRLRGNDGEVVQITVGLEKTI